MPRRIFALGMSVAIAFVQNNRPRTKTCPSVSLVYATGVDIGHCYNGARRLSDTEHVMISGEEQNDNICAVMWRATCCSRCTGAASGPPAKGRQAGGRVYGPSYEDMEWGKGGGQV